MLFLYANNPPPLVKALSILFVLICASIFWTVYRWIVRGVKSMLNSSTPANTSRSTPPKTSTTARTNTARPQTRTTSVSNTPTTSNSSATKSLVRRMSPEARQRLIEQVGGEAKFAEIKGKVHPSVDNDLKTKCRQIYNYQVFLVGSLLAFTGLYAAVDPDKDETRSEKIMSLGKVYNAFVAQGDELDPTNPVFGFVYIVQGLPESKDFLLNAVRRTQLLDGVFGISRLGFAHDVRRFLVGICTMLTAEGKAEVDDLTPLLQAACFVLNNLLNVTDDEDKKLRSWDDQRQGYEMFSPTLYRPTELMDDDMPQALVSHELMLYRNPKHVNVFIQAFMQENPEVVAEFQAKAGR